MKKFRSIIWDWNGTLLNDAALGHRVLADMCRERSMRIPSFEDYQRYYSHPVELIYQRAGFDLERESITALCEEWHDQYTRELESVALHHDALDLLRVFRRERVEQAVLSALPHGLLLKSIERNQVKDYFSHIQGLTDSLGRSKVENGHNLMRDLGCRKEETILIGDSSHDVETAAALGIECLLVARGYEHREKLERHGIRVVTDFGPILAEFSAI